MLSWKTINFGELTNSQLYDILALREVIFTFEQKCTDIDLDGLDKQAVHVVGMIDDEIIATARILPPGVYKPKKVNFGRLAIKTSYRGKGCGDELMRLIIKYIVDNYNNSPIELSAQTYLKSFYEKYGFTACGEVYDEGGIPHIKMQS